MALSNPFVVLSYVGGPAVLTNASSLFIMSTSNRFARAVDRSRLLAKAAADGTDRAVALELPEVARRLQLIARALTGFYLAAGTFALATLASILGMVMGEFLPVASFGIIAAPAVISGTVGFAAFVTGAISLVVESRIVVRTLAREAETAIAAANAKSS